MARATDLADRRSHPARDALLGYGRALPGIWGALDALRQRSDTTPGTAEVDEEVVEAVRRCAVERGGPRAAAQIEAAGLRWLQQQALIYSALAAWRYTQGIYRFDPAIYEAVRDTELRGDLPADVLRRLPEWCVYIETPGVMDGLDELLGAWVRVYDGGAQPMLCIYTHPRRDPMDIAPTHLPIHGALLDQVGEVISRTGSDHALRSRVVGYLQPIINLALYLCAGGDVAGKQGAPGNPAPVRVRHEGWRLFPADGPRMWDVGVRMGAALRRAYAAEQAGQTAGGGHHVRGHVRRAHWHTILSGPRLRDDGSTIPPDQRRADLRWLPPIPVALDDVDSLPAVVRPVRGA